MRISDWSSDVCSSDLELIRIYNNLDLADSEGLEHRTLTLAVRLQFAFAARMSEILTLQWDWIDFGNRRVAWPTCKTGSLSKPLSKEAALRSEARRVGKEWASTGRSRWWLSH